MSKKRPHVIMGQVVQGSSTSGYTVAVKPYESTNSDAYMPSAQDILNDLENDFDRLHRVVQARTYKLESKLSEEV